VCPSGANGVVGIKPTLGLWSRTGVVPISADQDTAGPMARNVTDAAVLLGAATGVDPADDATDAQTGHALTDYTGSLRANALPGEGSGVWGFGPLPTYNELTAPEVEPILEETIDALEAEGATIVDGMDIDLSATADEFPALLCEFKTDIATYLQTYTGPGYPKTLKALIDFDTAHPELEGPWGDEVFQFAEDTNGRDADCEAFRAGVTPPVQDAIDQLMADNDLDAIIALTNGKAWVTNPAPIGPNNTVGGALDGRFDLFVGSYTAAAVSGYADITVPAGDVDGLPIGITFIGGRWSAPELIGFAYDFEQATKVRVLPTFIPTIGPNDFPPPEPAARQAA